jgi:hypothetical protein
VDEGACEPAVAPARPHPVLRTTLSRSRERGAGRDGAFFVGSRRGTSPTRVVPAGRSYPRRPILSRMGTISDAVVAHRRESTG